MNATPLAGQLLALIVIFWAFSLMLRPMRIGHRSGHVRYGENFGSRLAQGIFFSVLLPAVWWTLTLVGRLYQRTFVVFSEFVTGVPDWVTYRTSGFKFGGATLAFVAYNAALFALLHLALRGSAAVRADLSIIIGSVAIGVSSGAAARALMRRAP